MLANPPSFVEYNNYRFMIFDAPHDDNLPLYLREFKKQNVLSVVRVCDPTYNVKPLEQMGITVYDLPFSDGDPPPKTVIHDWLNIVKETTKAGGTVGVHCVAGLGRAPVLVAVALIYHCDVPVVEVVDLIRKCRRGAINATQLHWLRKFKSKQKKSCPIM